MRDTVIPHVSPGPVQQCLSNMVQPQAPQAWQQDEGLEGLLTPQPHMEEAGEGQDDGQAYRSDQQAEDEEEKS